MGALNNTPQRGDGALMDLAVLQRDRTLASPPFHWPPLLKCDGCAMRFHGPCGWRDGVVESNEEGPPSLQGVVLRRKVYHCAPCAKGMGSRVGGAPLALPLTQPTLTLHTSGETRDITVLGKLF